MRAFLKLIIILYRRKLTTKPPFCYCRCSFTHTESCSAYAARILSSDIKLFQALNHINRRLKLCGQASLYRIPTGLVWGELYDQSFNEITSRLLDADENDHTRDIVLKTKALVNAYQTNRQGGYVRITNNSNSNFVIVRTKKAMLTSMYYKASIRVLLVLVIATPLLLFCKGSLLYGLILLFVALIVFSLREQWRHWHRFDQLSAMHAFSTH